MNVAMASSNMDNYFMINGKSPLLWLLFQVSSEASDAINNVVSGIVDRMRM